MSAARIFAPSLLRGEGWGEGRVLAMPFISPLPLVGEGWGSGAFAPAPWQVSKRFRAAAAARATSLLLVQKRSSPEKTTPRWRALRPSMGSGCAGGLRGFPTAPPCTGGKLARFLAGHPADFPPPARHAIGAPGEAARSCAQKQQHLTPALPCKHERDMAGARRFVVASTSVSGAHDVRLLFRGPWAAVRRGRSDRAADETKDGLVLSRGQEPARKARPRLTDLPGRTPGKRQPGWPSLLVTFLLATQEKSDSCVAGARKLSTSGAAKASRTRRTPMRARNRFEAFPGMTRAPRPAQKEACP